MLNEFKTFIATGNVLDLAVGIIIGAAFTAIVTSLVDDLINPLIGLIIGGIDFSTVGLRASGAVRRTPQFCLRQLHHRDHQVPDRGLGGVPARQGRATGMMPKKEEAPAAPAGPSDNDLLKEILAALKK